MPNTIAVLDVGKTNTKLSVVGRSGAVVASLSRANPDRDNNGVRILDADGIEAWVMTALGDLANAHAIDAIVPVAHGAAAALVEDEERAAPVLDYEAKPPAAMAEAYRRLRDPFDRTLSPLLPLGLNLGLQLFWQEHLHPALWPARAKALLWPQYWAWRLSGAMASEVTSLGCHTDLWHPRERRYSDLARQRGWDFRFPQILRADAVLGPIRAEIAQATGLARDCAVYCGLHDSNASLVAARAMRAVRGHPFTLVSTGTWFVALQSGGGSLTKLDERRDQLANADIDGNPTPSARFMGGREYEAILGKAPGATGTFEDVERVVARGAMIAPSFAAGSGPFPERRGALLGTAESDAERAAMGSLYLALMQDACLDLVGSAGPILIEGRFARDQIFASTLASLRPKQAVHRCVHGDGIALGGAALVWPELALDATEQVGPLSRDIDTYRLRWRDPLD